MKSHVAGTYIPAAKRFIKHKVDMSAKPIIVFQVDNKIYVLLIYKAVADTFLTDRRRMRS